MPNSSTRVSQRVWVEIILVLLLAAAVRIINSSHWPVWTDEGWTIWAVQSHDAPEILRVLAEDRHPPAYFLALSVWSTIAGESRIALRTLSIAIGLLTVAVIYRIGRDLFGHRPAVYAALLLAVLSMPVYYSQEIRHYGLLALSTCLMSLFFLRYLRHPTPGRLVPYVLSTALMLYTQFLGLAILGLQVLYGLLVWRGTVRAKLYLIGAWGVTGILYLPWLPATLVHISENMRSSGFGSRFGVMPLILTDFIRFLDQMSSGQLAVLGSGYVLGLIAFRRKERVYLFLIGLGLYTILFLFSLRAKIIATRTLSFLVPMLVLVCGHGFRQIQSPLLRRLLIGLAVIAVLARGEVIQKRIDSHHIAEEIAGRVDSSELIVLEMGWDNFVMQYELRQAGVKNPIFMPWIPGTAFAPDNPDGSPLNDIRPLLDDYRRVLVVNWIEPSTTIPLLEDVQYSSRRAFDFDLSIGPQLRELFTDRTVQGVLFERIDSSETPRLFGDLFELHAATHPASAHAEDEIFVDLWWSAATQPGLDYSVGIYLMDETQQVITQHDGAPGELPTSQWQSGDLYFDRHPITIPANLNPGMYSIAVSVYWYGDNRPLTVDDNPFAVIGQITID